MGRRSNTEHTGQACLICLALVWGWGLTYPLFFPQRALVGGHGYGANVAGWAQQAAQGSTPGCLRTSYLYSHLPLEIQPTGILRDVPECPAHTPPPANGIPTRIYSEFFPIYVLFFYLSTHALKTSSLTQMTYQGSSSMKAVLSLGEH